MASFVHFAGWLFKNVNIFTVITLFIQQTADFSDPFCEYPRILINKVTQSKCFKYPYGGTGIGELGREVTGKRFL